MPRDIDIERLCDEIELADDCRDAPPIDSLFDDIEAISDSALWDARP